MNDIDILKSYITICDLHQNRIKIALHHLGPLLPLNINKLNALSDQELSFLELLTSRFAKLQDTIGRKIFPYILKALQEYDSTQSFLDQLHKLEKLGFIEESHLWDQFRHIRNMLSHEYPDDPASIIKGFNECAKICKMLLIFWAQIKQHIEIRLIQH